MNVLVLIIAPFLLLSACTKGPKKDEALAAHNVATQVKEEWAKVEKPLEIEVIGRSQEELAAIGSLAVCVNGDWKTFTLRDSVFVPQTPLSVDSSAVVKGFYPSGLAVGDTIRFNNPMPPVLTGEQISTKQTNEKITIQMKLNEITALLRIRLESDDITDILHHIALSGHFVTGMREPNSGSWLEIRSSDNILSSYKNCILNSGRVHTFNLFPIEEPTTIGIVVETDKGAYTANVEIPPLRSGSVTELRLRIKKGKVSVGSSWVDTKHEFCSPVSGKPDTPEVGDYLQIDGYFSKVLTEESVAMVIETDGIHGKAVALTDNPEANVFMGNNFNFGKKFDNIDGKYSEGCFNAKVAEAGENKVAFSATATYPAGSAFSLKSGYQVFANAFLGLSDADEKILAGACRFPTAYIPSLLELAQLSQFVATHQDNLPEGFEVPEDFCISCCEKDKDTFYSLHVPTFRITCHSSKKYSTAALRLFYLF